MRHHRASILPESLRNPIPHLEGAERPLLVNDVSRNPLSRLPCAATSLLAYVRFAKCPGCSFWKERAGDEMLCARGLQETPPSVD